MFVVSTKDINNGILYLLEMHLEGKVLVKIGVTSRKIEDRVVEILTSYFYKYREFPYTRPKRFRETENVYSKETILHEYFSEYQYIPEFKFSGSTEIFDVDLDIVVKAYEYLLKNGSLDNYKEEDGKPTETSDLRGTTGSDT